MAFRGGWSGVSAACWYGRCERAGAGSPSGAVRGGFGDAGYFQAPQGLFGGGAAESCAPHHALGGDVGGSAALAVAHLVVPDSVVAAQCHGGEGDETVPAGEDGQVGGLAAHSGQRSCRWSLPSRAG